MMMMKRSIVSFLALLTLAAVEGIRKEAESDYSIEEELKELVYHRNTGFVPFSGERGGGKNGGKSFVIVTATAENEFRSSVLVTLFSCLVVHTRRCDHHHRCVITHTEIVLTQTIYRVLYLGSKLPKDSFSEKSKAKTTMKSEKSDGMMSVSKKSEKSKSMMFVSKKSEKSQGMMSVSKMMSEKSAKTMYYDDDYYYGGDDYYYNGEFAPSLLTTLICARRSSTCHFSNRSLLFLCCR